MPGKKEEIIYCEMTNIQRQVYQNVIKDSRCSLNTNNITKINNILMQLRKAAGHCILHRYFYTSDKLEQLGKLLLGEPEYLDSTQGNYITIIQDMVIQDLQVSSDYEIDIFLKNCSKKMERFRMPEERYTESGKLSILLNQILPQIEENGEKVLVFSQFTSVLNIIQEMLERFQRWKYARMDGQTPVAERQKIIDGFVENPDVMVFLLSTKAAGLGINLTVANVVIFYDQDYNPQNDIQAEDRCHRVGQQKDVRIIKLITNDSVEEEIYKCGKRKLGFEQNISEGNDSTIIMKIFQNSLAENNKENTIYNYLNLH